MYIDALTQADLPTALRISTQAGWNQLEADWRRLLDLWPEGCLAGREPDGRLVATATVASYGEVAWIGMVLVDAGFRSRGWGGHIFSEAMRRAQQSGGHIIGLDATDQGRRLYHKHGFVDAQPIVRWRFHFELDEMRYSAKPEAVLRLDDRRARLLEHLLREEGVTAVANEAGYAIRRPGRMASQIGPVVSLDELERAQDLVWALLHVNPDTPVFMDVPDNPDFEKWLVSTGWSPVRRLTRMYWPNADGRPFTEPTVLAAGGLELG